MTSEDKKTDLIEQIVEIELDMFLRVKTAEPSACQERPETFTAMRQMTHSVLSTETLESYLEDVQKAEADGRNLLTEKYARMANQIPPLKETPVIGDIATIEGDWMAELAEKYPHVFRGGATAAGFKIYLSSELETYSDKTLDLYFRDISKAKQEGVNLAEVRYNKLFQQAGQGSIAEMEERAKAKSGE